MVSREKGDQPFNFQVTGIIHVGSLIRSIALGVILSSQDNGRKYKVWNIFDIEYLALGLIVDTVYLNST